MSDISSLTSEIQNLEGWSSFWSKTGLVLGALTAAFGVLSAFAAGASYWYGTRLKPVQDELKRLKEEQVSRDLTAAKERASNADARAGEANEAAGRANERAGGLELQAQELEKQNLELRGGVANLEKEAANARAEQQRIQTDLAKQQERAANAELALLDIQERFQPRRLTPAQEEQFLAIVKEGPKGRVRITYAPNVPESAFFATQIFELLVFRAGWADVEFPEPDRSLHPLVGVQMQMTIANVDKRPPHAATLEKAFLSVGVGIGSGSISELPEGLIILNMALKPGKY